MESTSNDRNTVLSRYFSEIRSYPLLTKEQEQSLAQGRPADPDLRRERVQVEEGAGHEPAVAHALLQVLVDLLAERGEDDRGRRHGKGDRRRAD